MQLHKHKIRVTGGIIIVTVIVPTSDATQRLPREVGLTLQSVQFTELSLFERLVLGGFHPRGGLLHLSENASFQQHVLPGDAVQFYLLGVVVDLVAEVSYRVLHKHSIRLNISPPPLHHLRLMVLHLH